MSYTFTRTLPQLTAMVLRKLGALGVDQTPEADDTALVREAFDMRLKELHELGTLWFNVSGATTDIALTANVATKSLAAVTDFLFPLSVALRVSGEDLDVQIVSHSEYQAIPNKAETGEPEKVFFAPGGTAYFWPTPNQAYTAKLTYQAIAEDTTATGAPDIPVAMMRALASVIAMDLIDDYQVTGELAARLERKGNEAMKIIRTLNTERVDNAPVEMTSF